VLSEVVHLNALVVLSVSVKDGDYCLLNQIAIVLKGYGY